MTKSRAKPDARGFGHVRTWIFDLDNTLYPSSCNLFAQVDVRMGEYVSKLLDIPYAEAKALQKQYYWEHGTTLAGLMRIHKVDAPEFLAYVHDIDYSPVQAAPDLAAAIAALPAQKLIFTNGSRDHALAVTDRLGITGLFDATFDITDAKFVPKPRAEAYDHFLAAHGFDPKSAAMFEDLPGNLQAPHDLGMTTVLVHSDLDDHPIYRDIKDWKQLPEHIHHETDDLAGFLGGLREEV